MADTLPDGTSVSSQFGPEGWESIGKTFDTRQFGPEGWEKAVEFQAPTISLPSSPSGSFTVSGTWQFDDGRAIPGETVTVELVDQSDGSVVASKQTMTDSTGNYSVTFDPGQGDYEVRAYNSAKGRQFGPEGWEE